MAGLDPAIQPIVGLRPVFWIAASSAAMTRTRPDGLWAQAHSGAAKEGAKPGRTGKRIVARRGCAMMFTALWLTDARRNYFRS